MTIKHRLTLNFLIFICKISIAKKEPERRKTYSACFYKLSNFVQSCKIGVEDLKVTS